MRQMVWKFSLAVSALVGFSFLGAQTSNANEAVLNQVQEYSGDAGAISTTFSMTFLSSHAPVVQAATPLPPN